MSIEFITLTPTLFHVFKAGESNPKKEKRIVFGQAISDTNGSYILFYRQCIG